MTQGLKEGAYRMMDGNNAHYVTVMPVCVVVAVAPPKNVHHLKTVFVSQYINITEQTHGCKISIIGF